MDTAPSQNLRARARAAVAAADLEAALEVALDAAPDLRLSRRDGTVVLSHGGIETSGFNRVADAVFYAALGGLCR